MEIKEAIYVSEKNLTWAAAAMPSDLVISYKLGIEALQRLQDIRKDGYPRDLYPLPSETED